MNQLTNSSMVNFVSDIKSLSQIFQPIDVLSESCEIRYFEDGIRIPSVNKSKTIYEMVNVKKSAFDTFEEGNNKIGLGLEKLINVIDLRDPSEIVHFYLDEEKRYLRLDVGNKHFILGLLSLDAVPKPPEMPEVIYPVEFEISEEAFIDTIKTADVFGDKITFKVEKGKSSVEAVAQGDIDRINEENIASLNSSPNGAVVCEFGLRFLTDIVSVIPNDVDVEIKLAHDRPMFIKYPIIDGDGSVTFHVAPWAES